MAARLLECGLVAPQAFAVSAPAQSRQGVRLQLQADRGALNHLKVGPTRSATPGLGRKVVTKSANIVAPSLDETRRLI
jgi:hypothetical protein